MFRTLLAHSLSGQMHNGMLICSMVMVKWTYCSGERNFGGRIIAIGLKTPKCTSRFPCSLPMFDADCLLFVLLPGPDWLIFSVTASQVLWRPAAVWKTQQGCASEPTPDSLVREACWSGMGCGDRLHYFPPGYIFVITSSFKYSNLTFIMAARLRARNCF